MGNVSSWKKPDETTHMMLEGWGETFPAKEIAEPISAVVKAVTTTVTTAQTLSDYVSRYNIAEIQIVAMKTECSTVLSALLQLQDIRVQNDILLRPTASSESRTVV